MIHLKQTRWLPFKGSYSFEFYGFAVAGPHNQWLKRVEVLSNDDYADLLISKGFVAVDLVQLGMAYVGSKGSETEYTRSINKTIKSGLKRSN